MRYLGCLTAIVMMGTACAAYAQEATQPPAAPAGPQVALPSAPPAETPPAPPIALPPAASPPAAAAPVDTAPAKPAPAAESEPAASEEMIAPSEELKKEEATAAAPKKEVKAKPKPKPKAKPAAENWSLPPAKRSTTPTTPFGSEGGGAIPALPLDIMTNGNITYVTGGIGDEEVDMLRDHASEFNVQLLLTSTHGEYIGGVMVRVLGDNGAEVVTINDAGPYVFVKLPPGHYTLEGTATQGGIKSVKVNAPTTGATKAHIVYIE